MYGKTQTEALGKLRRAVRDGERGLVALSENSRLDDYLDQWLDVVRSRVQAGNLAPSTGVGYERVTRRFLSPRLGRVPLRKLTPGQVEALFGEMQAEGYAPGTIRHVRATLSRALSDAMRDELLYRNVARLVQPPHLERRHPSAFTGDEFRSIVATCAEDRLGALFLFTAYCGLRRSEALGLLWRDVDLDSGTFASPPGPSPRQQGRGARDGPDWPRVVTSEDGRVERSAPAVAPGGRVAPRASPPTGAGASDVPAGVAARAR